MHLLLRQLPRQLLLILRQLLLLERRPPLLLLHQLLLMHSLILHPRRWTVSGGLTRVSGASLLS